MNQFVFLSETTIGWDIIAYYILASIIGLLIFYNIIKAAVKNGIIEARDFKEVPAKRSPTTPEKPENAEQEKLRKRYERGEIKFEEYKTEWNKLSS